MADGDASQFLTDVLHGLALPQKAIPARWFYDDAGSRLFDAITQVPEYYPTRTETALLARHAPAIAQAVGPGHAVVEFGSGSSTKTPLLLRAVAPSAYVPIDISGDYLRASAATLQSAFPGLPVFPIAADFTHALTLPPSVADLPRLGFFPGSTIGNFAPAAAVDLLRGMRTTLGTDARLLIGIDRVKDVDMLLAAYDDAGGITARFNLNLLTRINRELGGDLPIDAFVHAVRWNDAAARIEMHLCCDRPMQFTVAGQAFEMAKGETIHTENSHKYGARDARLLLAAGGWTATCEWTDPADAFALILAEAQAPRYAP